MKLPLFTVAASLALSAIAAVPFYGRRDLNVTAGIDASTNISTFSNGTSPRPQTLPSGAFSDSDSAGVQDDHQIYGVHIHMGGPMQHVGTLRGYRLYWKIYEALKAVGEPRRGNGQVCNAKRKSTGECHMDYSIGNIVYNAQPHNTYATNAELTVNVRWSEIREKDSPGLRHELYALIANIYRLQTEDPANCYWVDFPESRRTTMCNLPTHLIVVFPVQPQGLQVKARVNVELKFNGASVEGSYNCKSSLSSISDLFHHTASVNLAKVCKMNYDPIKLYLTCMEDEKCFDVTEETYIENGYWIGPKGAWCPAGKPWY